MMDSIKQPSLLPPAAIRLAHAQDLDAILRIYNQGIEDRMATLESEPKDTAYIHEWFAEHQGRYSVLVAERGGEIVGWASLNRYSQRCAYDRVADLSVYVARYARGTGVGRQLLAAVEGSAYEGEFHKIVLFMFPFNESGQRLYRTAGYREVGVFKEQGMLDGKKIDVMIMEKLLESEAKAQSETKAETKLAADER